MVSNYPLILYGRTSPGCTSLLGECHQNIRTLELIFDQNCTFFLVWSQIGTGQIIYRKARGEFKLFLKNLKLNRTIFPVYLGLSCSILDYFGLSQSISVIVFVSWCILVYLGVSQFISSYLEIRLSWVISVYIGIPQAISGYLWLYLVISAIFCYC